MSRLQSAKKSIVVKPRVVLRGESLAGITQSRIGGMLVLFVRSTQHNVLNIVHGREINLFGRKRGHIVKIALGQQSFSEKLLRTDQQWIAGKGGVTSIG